MKQPLLIDTDPGVDDALAILMALANDQVDVVGLTIAAGNVGLQHTVANALKLLEVCGADIPVYAGCASPLVFAAADAAEVHGSNGFGDLAYEPATQKVEDTHAAQAIIDFSHRYAGELTLLALGPLTNIAMALRLDPSLPSRIKRFVVMGGAFTAHGNITMAAEFNIAFDPEAAHVVFESFAMTEVVDWEATIAHGLPHALTDAWCSAPSERAKFYDRISRKTRDWARGLRGAGDWHSADSLAMAYVLHPEKASRVEERPLMVETQGQFARGATFVDWNRQHGKPDNARLMLEFCRETYQDLVQQALLASN